MEFRRHPKSNTRQVMNYDRLLTLTGRKRLVCLDEAFISICRYLANTRGLFRTSYMVGQPNDVGYYIPDENQFNIIEHIIAEGNEDMSFCDEIQASLDSIVRHLETLSSSIQFGCSGCSGSGGAGTVEADPEAYTDDGVAPPTGYTDVTEYRTEKCNLAQYRLDQMVADLNRINTLDLVGLSLSAVLGGIGLVLLVPIPLTQIIGLASALVTVIITLGAASGVIQQAIDYIEAMDICLLYNAETVNDARDDVHADIDAQTFPLLDTLTKDILKAWFTYDSLNILFEPKPDLINLPTGNCACGTACLHEWTFLVDEDGFTFTDESDGATASATGSYDAPGERLQVNGIAGNNTNQTAAGKWTRDLLTEGTIQGNPGDTITVGLGGISDAQNVACTIRCVYETAPEDNVVDTDSVARDAILTLTQSDRIDHISVTLSRSTGPVPIGWNWVQTIQDVELNLSSSQDCPS